MTQKVEHIERKGGWTVRGYGGGGKGGGAARQPVEARDSLHSISYAQMLMLIGTGEVEGFNTSNALQSVFLDGTPIANADGSLNFQNVTVDYRAGTANQEPIEGFTSSESTDSVGVELRQSVAWTRSITDNELSAIRITMGVNGLSQANTENGDINGYRVAYAIDLSTDGGAFQEVVNSAFDGKTTSQYMRSHRISLPESSGGWVVRVRRITPNADSATIQDTTVISLISFIVDARFRYPMAALLAIKVDASQFSNIPTPSVDMKHRRIRVPSNYDAATRTYTGTWDGTFQTAWSDNPAWCFFDLVTNEIFGLGDRIPAGKIDRYALYQIGQYCDQLVPDGKGGVEPRFTCNIFQQARADAWRVLQDFVSIFRGMCYYASDNVFPVADMPKEPVYTYTNANVVNGRFNYPGSSRRTRYTVALVSWNDLTDQGRAKVEAVEDEAGIIRYGYNKTETVAFGCTSQGQAQRLGRWILLTSQMETGSVQFQVGMDGTLSSPGQIIKVADRNRAGRRIGGRLSYTTFEFVTVNGEIVTVEGDPVTVSLPEGSTPSLDTVTIDAEAVIAPGDQFTVTLPSGITETRTVESYGSRIVTVTTNFSEAPEGGAIWTVESEELAAQEFRVLDVMEGEGLTFTISAIQHVKGKFEAVDNQTVVQLPPITIIPPTVQPPPTNVVLSQYAVMNQGVSSQTVVISWDAAEGATYYDVQWKRDNSDWVTVRRIGVTTFEIPNAYAGGYIARVMAFNALDVGSAWANSALTQLDGIVGTPPAVTSLVAQGIVFGINVSWGFPSTPNIIEKTQVFMSTVNDFSTAELRGDYAYPMNNFTHTGMAAGVPLYFWARLVDKNGTVGPRFPSGTTGITGSSLGGGDAETILSYLTGKIRDTELAISLLERIDAGGESAIIIEQLTTQLAALYTLRTQVSVDGKDYIAGFAVGVEQSGGEVISQFLVAASRFAIIDPNTSDSEVSPFVVQGGQVFINSAVIGNASIGSAKLADWLESDAIGPGGQPVLRMNFRTGEIQLNSPVTGGGRMTLNNNVIQVYDAADTLRVRMGIWT